MVGAVEREAEDPGIIGDVLGNTEPRADNHTGDRRPIQYVADADIVDTHTVYVGDQLQYREQQLKQVPAAQGVDHALVFLQ